MSGPKLLEHMGAHILHDPHIKDADHPCGLCLNTGSCCVFHLLKWNKVDQIDMDNSCCPNIYKIQLSTAAKYLQTSPCMSVLLKCPLCSTLSNCIWKYNMHTHILKDHPSASINLYCGLFTLVEDEFVLMKAVYLAKPWKGKKNIKGF